MNFSVDRSIVGGVIDEDQDDQTGSIWSMQIKMSKQGVVIILKCNLWICVKDI